MFNTEREELKQRENELTADRWEKYQETGETVSHAMMVEWLETWGTDEEKSCPISII
jgi:predicted transcriptional regulator